VRGVRIPKVRGAITRARRLQADARMRRQIRVVEEHLRRAAPEPKDGKGPVFFFNASTRIHLPSLNAAFGLLASWAVRSDGVPVRYVVCHRGMDLCILGTKREDFAAAPPCGPCLRRSSGLFPEELVIPLEYDSAEGESVRAELDGRSIPELAGWSRDGLPLGELCLPGLRWALRRHRVPDDQAIRSLFRRYLASAASLARRFGEVFAQLEPRSLVVFNGIMYPEAVARAVAVRKGIPVVTHEVGLRPFSAFFSHGHATFREVELSPDYELSAGEERRLDEYLEARFLGRFTMAGIRFWPEMKGLPEELSKRISQHRQTVAVFTNVIFDTSQVHANTIFPDMFTWLEAVAEEIEADPQTLFVIRAHPDEERPGKASQETVETWLRGRRLAGRPNVAFFGPKDPFSSYELIRRSKVVLVYNSSIGLEATILGAPVLCAGRARYTQIPTVFFPPNRELYGDELRRMLQAEAIEVPPEFAPNARRFLSYELYQASLDLSEFLVPYPGTPGMVEFSGFSPDAISRDEELAVIRDGVLEGRPFVMGESSRVPSDASGGRP
jgi:hypothetical protein